jgi:hypothetical protein
MWGPDQKVPVNEKRIKHPPSSGYLVTATVPLLLVVRQRNPQSARHKNPTKRSEMNI